MGKKIPLLGSHVARRLGPHVDDLVVTFTVGNHAVFVEFANAVDLFRRFFEHFLLLGRNNHFRNRNGRSRNHGPLVTESLEIVKVFDRYAVSRTTIQIVDGLRNDLLAKSFVRKSDVVRDDFVQDDASHRRLDEGRSLQREELDLLAGLRHDVSVAVIVRLFRKARRVHFERTHIDLSACGQLEVALGVQVDNAVSVSAESFGGIVETHSGSLAVRTRLRNIIEPEHDILSRNSNRLTGSRMQDVVRRKHEDAAFELRFEGKRKVHRHLVTVKVRIESGTDKRVQTDGAAFDEFRIKSLDTQAVKGRCAVQHHRMVFDNLFESIPYFGTLLIDKLLCSPKRIDLALFF